MKFIYAKFIKNNKLKFSVVCLLAIAIPIISNTIPFFSQKLLDGVLIPNNFKRIAVYILVIILLYIAKYAFNAITQAIVVKINLSTISEMKKEVFNDIINLPIVFHDSNSSEYILSRINEVDSISNLFSAEMVNFIVGIIAAIAALGLILSKSVALTISALLSLPILYYVTKKAFGKIHDQIYDLMETSAKTNEDVYSNINGALTLKQFNNENDVIKRVNSQIDALIAKTQVKSLTISNNSNLVIALVVVIQNLLVGFVALLINKGSLSIGNYLSISQYLALIYAPILSFQTINVNMKPAIVAYKRLNEFYSNSKTKRKDKKIFEINSIVIQNLYFHYPDKPNILSNINLSLNRGDKLWLSGSNGSGKTTLSKILLGFYDDYQGSISFDSTEIRDIDEANLRDNVSILPQKNYLFNSSIRDNIRIANKDIKEAEFREKLDYFHCIKLLDGIDMEQEIKDNGKNLSGGQIQRIALARMLLRNTNVCIFDEFNNSLDSSARITMEEIIKNEFNDKICIFITHDNYLSDICNKALNLDKEE